MAVQQPYDPTQDPFADSDNVPAISFADAPVGTVYSGRITSLPKELQDRDFATGKPKFWDDGQPMMVVVLRLQVQTPHGEEERGVWARKPSSLFRAIGAAQKASGKRLELGGTLAIRLVGTQPAKNPRHNPQKLYEARYEPPADTLPDPWAAPTASAAPANTPAPQASPATSPATPPSW